jgi:hypothetical protein
MATVRFISSTTIQFIQQVFLHGSVAANWNESRAVTEHVALTAIDIRNKNVALSFIPDPDTSNTSLNIVGGVAQNYGEDYYIKDSKIKWDGMNLDGELQPGDIFRILYTDEKLSKELKVSLSLKGSIFTVKYFNNGWQTLIMKNIASYYLGPWETTFMMDTPNPINHDDIYGKGFVSQFVAIGASFINSTVDSALTFRTERKTITLYKGDTTAERLIDTYFDYEVL